MSRSTRLFEIIQVLRQSTGPVTARQIAEGLEVTVRTVYRDIAALQAMRLPIHGEAGVGYVLRSGFDLPPLMFSQDELEAIVVGLAMLGRTGDPGLERAARNASAKISEVLPEGTRPPAALHVSRWNRMPKAKVEAGALRRYIRDEAELRITYVDLQDQRTERRIRPLALIYYIDAVVLAAWCGLRQDFRHFRIDRIPDCGPTGETFVGQSAALLARWERENRPPE
ncbi:MAG: YafY family transcriptional regulator [Alphaproteobacteria bacterium]|nr:YafY family transcriptional regulator [Alphaproteobacteria bacterium]